MQTCSVQGTGISEQHPFWAPSLKGTIVYRSPLNNCSVFPSAGSLGYGSDYEEEARYTPNGPDTSAQPPYHSPENEQLRQQLIDHHRDSPRPPFAQPQMVQGMMGSALARMLLVLIILHCDSLLRRMINRKTGFIMAERASLL